MNSARAKAKLMSIRKEIDEVLEELDESGELPSPPARMKLEAYAKHRDVSIRTVYRWVRMGLPVERRFGVTRVMVVEADAWDEKKAIARDAEIEASGGKKRG